MSKVTLQERADAASVKVFMAKDRAPEHSTAIAELYALSCERGDGRTAPSADDVINQLKIKAARVRANAVVGVALSTGWQPNPFLRRGDIKCSNYILAVGIAVNWAESK